MTKILHIPSGEYVRFNYSGSIEMEKSIFRNISSYNLLKYLCDPLVGETLRKVNKLILPLSESEFEVIDE